MMAMALYPWMVSVTLITWFSPASADDKDAFSFLSPPPQQFCGSLNVDDDGAGPLDDDEG